MKNGSVSLRALYPETGKIVTGYGVFMVKFFEQRRISSILLV